MAKRVTPAQRASEAKKKVARVRRKYKRDLTKSKKLLPAEEVYVADMVVVLKLAGYSRGQIGSVLGISKGQVKLLLERPEVAERLLLLSETLPEAALELLQGYMIEAVQTVVDVMRVSTDDKMVLQAAAEILDRGGIPKASRQERLTESTENFTITDDGLLEKLRELSPEVQEQAAQLIEELEKLTAEAAEGTESEDSNSGGGEP
jgi:hypothetical protein